MFYCSLTTTIILPFYMLLLKGYSIYMYILHVLLIYWSTDVVYYQLGWDILIKYTCINTHIHVHRSIPIIQCTKFNFLPWVLLGVTIASILPLTPPIMLVYIYKQPSIPHKSSFYRFFPFLVYHFTYYANIIICLTEISNFNHNITIFLCNMIIYYSNN